MKKTPSGADDQAFGRNTRYSSERAQREVDVNWIRNSDGNWYLLDELPLTLPSMRCDGIYILWYFDESHAPQTVRVGMKGVNDHLGIMLKAEGEKYAEHPLYITWAEVKSSSLDDLQGIWAYLCKELEPLVGPRCPQVDAIRVGLPWDPIKEASRASAVGGITDRSFLREQRIIDPPEDQWDRLPTQLTPGEREVFELFKDALPLEWEMYIQPHLNGLRPDLVLLNPYAGIGVFEIKDWSLSTLQNTIEYSWKTKSPIKKIKLYEDEIFNLYCPRLDDRNGKAVISAGLIFTRIPQAEVNRLLNPFRDGNMRKYPDQYPFSGAEGLEEGNIDALFPEQKKWGQRNPSLTMSSDTANDLRGWLKEPAFSKEQRESLKLNDRQHQIATEPTPKLHRKVRGPAGSGKSQALAARATVLANEGKRVLVCTFNITLMNYLRDLVARHARGIAKSEGGNLKAIGQQIEFRHFHGWCKRICTLTGRENDYFQLWTQFPEESEAVLEEHMAKLVSEIYTDPSVRDVLPIYDAILVDEAQDYNKDWWQTLRAAVEPEPDGEMLLVSDKTQNIYGKDLTWLDESLRGTRISPTWYNLETSYRVPPEIVPILEDFAKNFLIPSGVEVDIPKKEQREQKEPDFDPKIKLRWVQVSSVSSIAEICFEEARWQMKYLRNDTAIPDIIFLTSSNDTGLVFGEKCKEKGVSVRSTFGQEDQEPDPLDQEDSNLRKYENSRRKKLAFFLGDARIKATTLHSFKGWEGRHLILHVSHIASPENRALFYTALTRLKKHPNGSMLTVVSSCPELYGFGEKNFLRIFSSVRNISLIIY